MLTGIRLGRGVRLTTMILAALALCLGVVLGSAAFSAQATETPAPTPAPTDSGDFTTTYTIGGILRDGDTLVEGAEITVEGSGFSETATTDDTGRWSVVVPGKGDYTVTLDADTLPDGVTLRDPDRDTAEVAATEWQTNTITRSFPLGVDTRQTTGFFEQFLQRLAAGLNFGLLIALAAIGITLIFGTTGLNNFAHGEMVTFGAIIAWIVAVILGINIFVAMLIALVLGGVFGYLQDWLLWKPLRRKGVRLVQAMIVSIGLAIALRYLYLFFIGGDTKTMSVGLSDAVVLGPVRITTGSILSMVITATFPGVAAMPAGCGVKA